MQIKKGQRVVYTKNYLTSKAHRAVGKVIWIEPKNNELPYQKVKVDETITVMDDLTISSGLERLTCENCKDTLGYLDNECSNNKCHLYHKKQKGIMRPYKN